ncbi:TPA: exodeoxyribonuclease V subunit beta [Klebsiella pneumoniae]|jgi:exodeoxyribonuclease V beta subunit|uniref:RecBCD enzyme subunit RecB n=23 Tax=Klebsiella pneumoniae TaxID=573 RepID=A0A2V3KI35_KLEPN|nr:MULTISPECIES: exodeoxyribonuclease V subunit beta [Klebsiella]AGT22795.1 exonuclease V subunit beta [Klebsiella pneumoniae JM45]AHM83421.1 Exodeoxyribonuclease V beta chain [Klebsiella pneumoniae 30660/NJST258_1]AKR98786.1 exonuclease V subunit beta [Klebsiella pneumoniae UHKPC33]EJK20893.1 exonuclease V subunit beta [Klebsiella pneumoniae subsp. pneumoniae KPNIH19]ELJ5782616.1 exodeoxyribonuclease V subunit beta [Klebsiella pneumoniae subsp. pneumoniae HS11286]MBT9345251.1 exodeoxyribonuc
MTDTAESLDPLRLPLIGERLIEASAGTGKTFTIAALYLRLLLGLGGEAAYPRAISVEELLVVTFTEAATEELRGRIRSNIHELRIACLRGESDNPLYSALLAEIADKDDAAKTLLLAERQMDEAAVFTIHGFCQRMLSLNAFESGMLFEQQLIEDESRLRYQACADFWRRHCYPLTRDIAAVIHDVWKGPRDLLKSLDRWLQGEAPQLKSPPAPNETLAERHQQIIARIDSLKQQWREQVGEIEGVLENSGLDRRKFNRGNQGKWMEKVNAWAQEETLSYQLPDALEKFAQSFLLERTKAGGEPPVHPLFSAVESLLASSLTLTDLVLARAMVEIRDAVAREKRRRGELGFDDMLSRLDEALRGDSGETLASAIRQRFPVAMIDEFQDTDPQQYRIFRRIWRRQPETALLLIGDPKQAIYAFRGADIFTYMKARGDVAAHYTLDTNWRSSPGMVGSVNRLFSLSDNPFMFHEIPFLPVKAAAKNKGLRFTVDAADVPAMNVWLMPGDTVGSGDYQTFMAQLCATQIRDWLSAGQRGRALLWRGETSRPVQASDITVLVRNRLEAAQVREALQTLGIPSVYLSNRDSVFETLEAQELLWLLQAVLAPERENTLRSALATSMFGLTALDIENLNQDEQAWDALVEEFSEYRQIWRQRGVMPMLRALMTARHIAENLLATRGGERRLTDILHISELLQEAASQLESEHALVRWLAQHIAEPDSNAASQQMRLESDKHLVQIVTIHKSKGLEYPLVWLPFIARFRKQDQAFYHDRETFAAVLDLGQDEASLELAEAERLAEDLRLLYVALTRAVWHCSLGVAPLSSRKSGNSDFHLSALGRLLQAGEAMDAAGLAARLADFCHGDIALQIPGELDLTPWQAPAATIPRLSARELQRRIADDWRVTSYSGLQQHGFSGGQDLLPRLDVDAAGVGEVVEEPQLTPHQFPRGAAPGTFLHSLFEELDFTQPVPEGWMAEKLQLSGFDAQWAPVLTDWLGGVLKTRLPGPDIALNQLAARDKQVEMAFYLPIAQLLTAERLDALIRQYDPLSADTPPLDFRQVRGMLKGFIDLVFRHEGRYYLLDYKSNWLGEDREAYTRPAMEQAMRAHRYDLQYQLYSLALHRYLRHRLADYDYDRHFGGVIYLFLRGMDGQEGGQGIFTTRPVRPLIDGLDQLFAGETQEEAS